MSSQHDCGSQYHHQPDHGYFVGSNRAVRDEWPAGGHILINNQLETVEVTLGAIRQPKPGDGRRFAGR
jgi:hypothetical protein